MKRSIRSLFIVLLVFSCFFFASARGSSNSEAPKKEGVGDTLVGSHTEFDHELYQRLIQANDQTVSNLLNKGIQKDNPRSLSVQFGILTASFCTIGADYFNSEAVFQRLMKIMGYLLDAQRANGTVDAGGNKQSPPDTAFLIDNLGPAAKVLANRNSEESMLLKKRLDDFLLSAGEALITGGIHTPNHRWVTSSALAHLYQIYGDNRYKERIEEWLSEGIYIDEDGQYPERSRIYSKVVDHALITMATILGRPDLLKPVRKNLETTFFLMENNGDLVSLDSRRQDQNMIIQATNYYWCYRFIAVRLNDSLFAAIARKIEDMDTFDEHVLSGALLHFLDVPLLQKKLSRADALPEDFNVDLSATNMVRMKRDRMTATVFGGNDFPLQISSGRSTNPTFFTFRKGEAILEYARLSTSFFNTGYFRSEGLRQEQNSCMLHERKEAYYYQPLPADKQNPEGDYKLTESPDGRFWSKMDFKDRSVSDVQAMETDVTIRENKGEFELVINVDGPKGVDVTLELCFRSGGQLSAVQKSENESDFFLKEGYATYQFGSDKIQVGPGIREHQNVGRIDGELYSTHFGSIKGKGMHLFLTGRTPFLHVITLK
ncbi:hypothetical protein [Mangrovibacterium lignilyticum]|uniref:hypothetical protein n=1 Tax=Mangrovibacterium lignilyticum TaxID=2668052 RepID=UPI0013D1DCA0|nr:hypothetical protein [Mangrovibacterium lignilyticum]